MKTHEQIINNPPLILNLSLTFPLLDALCERAKNDNYRQKLAFAFGDDKLLDIGFFEFCSAVGLYGLARTIASLYDCEIAIYQALCLLPGSYAADDLFYESLIIAGIKIELGLQDDASDDIVALLKVIHPHKTITNFSFSIENLYSEATFLDYTKQDFERDLQNGLTHIAAIKTITEFAVGYMNNTHGTSKTIMDFMTDDDIARLNSCDLAVLGKIAGKVEDKLIDLTFNIENPNWMDAFMAVYEVFSAHMGGVTAD